MRRLVAFSAFLVVVFAAGGSDLSACGEKFFFAGRFINWQQAMAAPVPGAVLLYTNPASKLPAVLQETKLDQLLKRAGHKVEMIADAGALSRALRSGRYDILLIDPADAGQAAQWKAAAPGVVVVPVLYRPTKTEQQAAEKTYARVLKADKTNDAISLVNNVIKARPKIRATP
jgi:hypothetical protein